MSMVDAAVTDPPVLIPGRSSTSMAPIHSLPVELLTRIFIAGTQHDGPYPDFPLNDDQPFEVVVSHVCSHWRAIALRTARLWTTIHFRIVPHLYRAFTYLSRSKKNLIDILVDTCALEEHKPGVTLFREEFMTIFAIATLGLRRWRSLSLKVRDVKCKAGARTALSECGYAPNLEYLHLWHIEQWDSPERLYTQIGPPPTLIFEGYLPKLKHITLIGVNVPWTQAEFLQDLQCIEFALHSENVRIPYDVWHRMLSTSKGLEKLSLHYSGPRPIMEDWTPDVIELPSLSEVILIDQDPPYTCDIFRRLSCPNVTRLTLTLPDQDATQLVEQFAERPPPLNTPPANNANGSNTNSAASTTTTTTAAAAPAAPVPNSNPPVDNAALAATNEPAEDGEDAEGEGDSDEEEGEEVEEEETEEEGQSHRPRPPTFPMLDTLIIGHLDCTPQAFRKFLQASPRIERLELALLRLAPGMWEEFFYLPPGAEDPKGKGVDLGPSVLRIGGPSNSSSRHDRAGSADSSSSSTTQESETTAMTTPATGFEDIPVLSSASPTAVLLPNLHTIRISGVRTPRLRAFINFRREQGRPIRNWYVSDRFRDAEGEMLAEEMEYAGYGERLKWYSAEDDEERPGGGEDDGSSEGEESEGEGDEDEEGYEYEDDEELGDLEE